MSLQRIADEPEAVSWAVPKGEHLHGSYWAEEARCAT
jgi:hypothetical protein